MQGVDAFDRFVDEYDQWFDRHPALNWAEVETLRRLLPRNGVGVEIGAGTGIEPSRPMAKYAHGRGCPQAQGGIMKLILTTVAPDLDAALDRYFGSAAYFLVVDSYTLEWQSYPNPGAPTAHAAGTRAAILASQQKPDAVISGDYGPYCYIGLEAAGIPMYLYGSCKTARESVDAFRAGQLKRVSSATMPDLAA